MDPFAKHKIDHLSPSSLNTFADQPAFWVLRYLMGYKDEAPAMWRGSAVEAGVDTWAFGRDDEKALAAALTRFEEEAQGEITDAIEKERLAIPGFLTQATTGWEQRQYREPHARQLKVEHWFDDIEVPVIGYVDYEWQDFGIDLKTTRRIPTEIPGRHARQISLYSTARQKPYRLLYASEKKHAVRELSRDEVASHLKHLYWYARTLRRALMLFSEAEDIIRLFPPDFENFKWKNETFKARAMEILDADRDD